ncbi:hypothetical protein [Planctomycetes bacterium K23_9]|uniref:Uncharacterized protein n=1 Tax=Stieleria marina TaxID=1930275 RepID=A0A517NX29_9BACT|nr:hypothetical protein K239x_36830 [Planctomycetes bacterium K23_9]
MTNPYAPPSAESQLPAAARRSTIPQTVRILVTIVGTSFVGFTFLLLNSTPLDKKAGLLFLFNVPFVLAWIVLVLRSHRRSRVAGIACGIVQVIISALMLLQGIGDKEFVLGINLFIAVVPLILSVFSRPSSETGSTLP